MKTKISRFHALSFAAAAMLLSTLNAQLATCFAQGSLTPPGAPAPTMKSLDQIEARTPIASAPFTITSPGSYYLTTNVTVSSGNAVTINANNVTLDLGGFTISSTENPAANGNGVALGSPGPVANITILNGFISSGVTNNGSGTYTGTGFGFGIDYPAYAPSNMRVFGVSVTGCRLYGIYLGFNNTVVESCTVNTAGTYGITAATVSDSVARDSGSIAMYVNTAHNCVGYNLIGNGDGIDATTAGNCFGFSGGSGYGINSAIAENCVGYSSGSGTGLYVLDSAVNCEGNSSSSYGLLATTATGCYGNSLSGTGIYTDTAENCYGSSAGGGDGIYAVTAQNCHGSSSTGTGLYAFRSAVSCYGQSAGASGVGLYVQTGVTMASFGYNSTATGLGLQAYVATGCYGQNSSGTSESINNKYNMP